MGPFKDFQPGINRSAFGCAFNTQKYSVSLDYSKPRGQQVVKDLIKWADIVSDSMTPGSLARWGLDYESVVKFKPDIIYFSTCQMGHNGPLSKFGGYGTYGAAYGGFSQIIGYPDRTPLPLHNNYNDFVAPWYLVIGLIAALLHRKETGEGTYLDQSQIEAGITMLAPMMLDYAINGNIAGRVGNRDSYMCPHNAYPCEGDDHWVVIAVRTDKEWQALCRIIGKPQWTKDPKFATFVSRKQNEDELDNQIADWTNKYPAEHVMAIMQEAGVPSAVMLTSGEGVVNDLQLKHRKAFVWLDHKEIGPVLHNSPSYRLSKTEAHIWKAGPCLGEDNEYVFKEILGYSDDEIADLLMEGVITTEADLPGTAI
jgi:benzylsuccinate CoA-transferase BbsF subunit